MNVNLALRADPIATRAHRPTRRTAMERLVLAFACLGMIASLVAFVSYTEALKNQLKPDELYSASIVSRSCTMSHTQLKLPC